MTLVIRTLQSVRYLFIFLCRIIVGPHDLLIAATCLHHDFDLATLNNKEFSRIPGLRLAPVSRFAR